MVSDILRPLYDVYGDVMVRAGFDQSWLVRISAWKPDDSNTYEAVGSGVFTQFEQAVQQAVNELLGEKP